MQLKIMMQLCSGNESQVLKVLMACIAFSEEETAGDGHG